MGMPSYRSLYVFCQTIKFGSVKEAANRLNVSPSAISHLIRSLETMMEVPLMERDGRVLRMTPDGERLYKGIGDSFSRIDDALHAFVPNKKINELRVTTTPSFFTCWLSPRISKFTDLYPEYKVIISGTTRTTKLSNEPWDIAIRWLKADSDLPDGLCTELLWQEELACFVSSAWQANNADTTFEDFAKQPKIHALHFPDHWRIWAESFHKDPIARFKFKAIFERFK